MDVMRRRKIAEGLVAILDKMIQDRVKEMHDPDLSYALKVNETKDDLIDYIAANIIRW